MNDEGSFVYVQYTGEDASQLLLELLTRQSVGQEEVIKIAETEKKSAPAGFQMNEEKEKKGDHAAHYD